ncbi:hypothetical protein [Aurantiacibacter gangjinensis]|uniref:Uncharacterized protein n=1 Tax=Aurantiacibacter gangjinensis TaxID=502682 RepID=A0A0G9ML47_9SPHN|nr:hypothetical protein [Aurantiacibacter gangjinensis]APE27207.1 hypothetical protein BMF35_a0378 [Aurantiacibacter gangjinensis]KLE31334.1 hypothetical protein AAW01_06910 [Aurantiacibacter gangjinensis]
MIHRAIVVAVPLSVLAACTSVSDPAPQPQAQFWSALSTHCGKAYQGGLVSEDSRDLEMTGNAMIAHWAECSDDRIAIAFHIQQPDESWNRSRTWIVTRTAAGLRLKHDHRHEDGSEDAVTQYGGDTATSGTAFAQDFPVDDYSIAMFQREGLDLSLTNVWRMETAPAGEDAPPLTYQLTRENDPTRLFRVSFEADQEIAPPPPAWGW